MPILTFWGLTPSGASARAVFAFRKGKKARFGGAKWRPEKLSTISTTRNPELGTRSDNGEGRTAIGQARPCFRNGASMCLALFPLPLPVRARTGRERVAEPTPPKQPIRLRRLEGRVRGWPLIAPSPPPPLPRWGEGRTRHAKHEPARKHGTPDRRFRQTPSRPPHRRSGPPRGP